MRFAPPPGRVDKAIRRLSGLTYLSRFSNFEDWVSTEYFDGHDQRLEPELEQFNIIYRYVTLEYRKLGFYPSSGFMSDVIFRACVARNSQNFINFVQTSLAASTATSASVLIFPLQGIGFASHKAMLFLNPLNRFYYDGPGFRIIPQTNSYKRTILAIREFISGTKLKYKSRLDYESFEHFRITRKLKWLTKNPLLLCSFNFTQDLPLDNFWVLYERITSIASKVYLAKALSTDNTIAEAGLGLSTANVNNFETRDVRHFLTVTSAADRPHVICQPMAMARNDMIDDSEFGVTIDIDAKRGSRLARRAFDLVDRVEIGLAEYRFHNRKHDEKYYRLNNSIRFFRRSIRARSTADKVIALNIAFESLLIDREEMQKREPMIERTWKVARLARYKTKTKLVNEFGNLVDERNAVVHGGAPITSQIDFPYLNHLYAQCVIRLGRDIALIDSTKKRYLEAYFTGLK